ncbi:MAG: octaprenyl diphosphate synthase [Gammaproteobacteria bacterium 39-13]|mgnify:CR=1 FL=1|nr:polyprenyl synthetase family protein [Gammaproteobacteria bacterium]OJV90343.1 MAG: octaprenyl diphosphate synthase [Gammaproteobacteria bacterium 39-13]
MPLTTITDLLATDLQAVNQTIIRCLESRVEVINKIGHYMIESGGKRIRPLVVLLSAKACDAKNDTPITMAAIIEFIHTATLLHDDVVDGSTLRRGRPTANRVWDNPTAVLVGDFLYSRAFQMIVSLNSMDCMRIMAEATNVIAEGEVLQLAHRYQPDIDESRYLNVIRFKTAKLFEAAAQLGAILANQPREIELTLAQYGMHIGTAFQLVDDVLDYQAANESWGKNIGDDLAEGKATLPLIYALKKAPEAQAKLIRQAIQHGSLEDLSVIQEAIVSTGAIDYTLAAAKKEIALAKEALAMLPSSRYKDAMLELATFAISRKN